MKPTIGRIVIYKYTDIEKCPHTNGATECPAIIVRVWSDTCVNLKLLEDGPQNSWKTSVLTSSGELIPGQWQWPGLVEQAPRKPLGHNQIAES